MKQLLLLLALVAVTACTSRPGPALSLTSPDCAYAASPGHGVRVRRIDD